LIFPEGGRSPDGWGQPFRGGAAFIALRAGVPVVPIHLDGTGRVLRKGGSLSRSQVTVTFGDPLRPHDGEDARKYAVRIEAAVAALADEVATDWWTARQRAYAKESPSLGGPDAGAWRRAWALGAKSKSVTRRRRRWPDI
jgi:1-acyl-sn-glycerol-3-phosphate acyltransferase